MGTVVMAKKEFDLEEQVKRFEQVRPEYRVMAEVLDAMLKEAARDLGLMAIVQVRAKELPSFAEKCIRKRHKYWNPLWQLTDLCGARVITECKDDIEPVCEFIRRHFEIDAANSEDVLERLGVSEFGYRSVHFVVSLKPGEFDQPLAALAAERGEGFRQALDRLYERRSPAEAARDNLPAGPRFKAEIQVRTLLQHAWAALGHDRIYKSEFDVPPQWRRDMNRIAAAMEDADEDFARAIRGVESYKNYYGAYMTRKQRADEVHKLQAVSRYDGGNMRLAHRIARIAISLEDWATAESSLERFALDWEDSDNGRRLITAERTLRSDQDADEVEQAQGVLESLRDSKMAGVLMDYGWAQWKEGKTEARKYLEWAVALDPANVDARVVLADSYMDTDCDAALEYYEKAFEASPSDPRALGRYVHCKMIVGRTLDFVPLMRPSLEDAIECCRERARVGVYLPQAYYDIGLFALLLGRPYESLAAYAKAVSMTESATKLEAVLRDVEKLQKALRNLLPPLEWVRRLIRLGRLAEAWKSLAAATDEVETARLAREKAEAKVSKPEGKAAEAKETHEHARQAAEKARADLATLQTECLAGMVSRELPAFDGPVVIAAGGCDRSVEDRMREYRALIEGGFDGFTGTVYGGGTTAGISGIIGSLPETQKGLLRKMAYLPGAVPPWTELHRSYEVHYTEGERFSALEPLQNWIDLMAAGVDPAQVRVLGVNGGAISAFEYRLALLMGAKVGVLRNSGRAANTLFEDEDWCAAPGLLALPADTQTLRAFVRDVPPAQALQAPDREFLARRAHEEYRQGPRKRHLAVEPALADWEELHPNLKQSNYAQVDHIEEKMRTVGLTLRKASPKSLRLRAFTEEEVESLAEMEHGRWNVERLLAGWTLGEKDVEKKRSPYLVAWSELPEDIKEYDRAAVRAIPGMLKELGYEIRGAGQH